MPAPSRAQSLLLLLTLATMTSLFTACAPERVFYADAVTRAAAPEVVQAWDNLGWWQSRQRVDLPSQDAGTFVSQDLAKRKPAPTGVLIAGAVTPAALKGWTTLFPHTRFVVFSPTGGDAVSAAFVAVNRLTAWNLLASRAAEGRKPGAGALAVVSPSEQEAALGTLRDAWKKGTSGGLLTVVALDSRSTAGLEDIRKGLAAGIQDLFLLAGESDALVPLPDTPGLRIHTDLSQPDTAGKPGWSLRVSPAASSALWDALAAGAPNRVDLPVEAYLRAP